MVHKSKSLRHPFAFAQISVNHVSSIIYLPPARRPVEPFHIVLSGQWPPPSCVKGQLLQLLQLAHRIVDFATRDEMSRLWELINAPKWEGAPLDLIRGARAKIAQNADD